LADIRNYCETDVVNTYLVYLRFQLMRGILDERRHAAEIERLQAKLEASESAHLGEFLHAWRATAHAS
jgi:predicted PolB exonuclease-like 3'-5' exonuclease